MSLLSERKQQTEEEVAVQSAQKRTVDGVEIRGRNEN
jgi:hypothetical protein